MRCNLFFLGSKQCVFKAHCLLPLLYTLHPLCYKKIHFSPLKKTFFFFYYKGRKNNNKKPLCPAVMMPDSKKAVALIFNTCGRQEPRFLPPEADLFLSHDEQSFLSLWRRTQEGAATGEATVLSGKPHRANCSLGTSATCKVAKIIHLFPALPSYLQSPINMDDSHSQTLQGDPNAGERLTKF